MTARGGGIFYRALGTMFIAQVVSTLSIQTIPVLAPAAAADIGVDPGMIGVFGAVLYIGGAVVSLICSGLILGHGSLRVSQACLVLAAVALAIAGGAHWALFLLTGLLVGMAYGPTTPASSNLLVRHTPSRFLALVLSIKQMGVPIGGAAAGLLVPVLVVRFGWDGAVWCVAAICAVTALVMQPTRRELDADRDPNQPPIRWRDLVDPILRVWKHPRLRELAMISMAYASAQSVVNIFFVTYVVASTGLSLIQAGLALTIAQFAAAFGRLFWGAVGDWLGRRSVLAGLGFAMSGCAVAMAAFTPEWPFWSILLVGALFGGTAVGWHGVFLAEITSVVDTHETSRATGGVLFFTYFAIVIVPTAFSVIIAVTGGYDWAFALVTVLTAGGGFLLARRTFLEARPKTRGGAKP